MSDVKDSGLHDLRHFLRLARAQLRHRIKESLEEGRKNVNLETRSNTQKLNVMTMLEELIKEQVPDENTRHSAR